MMINNSEGNYSDFSTMRRLCLKVTDLEKNAVPACLGSRQTTVADERSRSMKIMLGAHSD